MATYRKFKDVNKMTPDEVMEFKKNEFDFNENLFGGFVICDSKIYTEIPENCKPETIPISFREGNYRNDGIADGFMDENEEVYVSESEMEASVCIDWYLGDI